MLFYLQSGNQMEIRHATVNDAIAIAHVRVITWQQAYRGIIQADLLDNLDESVIAERWVSIILGNTDGDIFTLVAVNDVGLVCGFTSGGPERNADIEYQGEIYALYVHPGSQRCGVGKALVSYCAEILLEQSRCSMLIWVLAQNHIGCSFYEKLGGNAVRHKEIEIGTISYPEIGYGWKNLTLLRVESTHSAVAPDIQHHR